MNVKVSVIIRTKNEEFWIERCLAAIKAQVGAFDIEVILVDNQSTDRTIDKALLCWPKAKLVTIETYNPARALNMGVKEASGEYCVCISAHCVPESEDWLSHLLKPLGNDDVCASYGRQLPLPTSAAKDKRDLWLTFGLDDVLQTKDPFLHNANSAYRRRDLVLFPFNEGLTNIEDRSWGQSQIMRGQAIYYVAAAAVYHDHGIHQTGNIARLNGVISTMDAIHGSAGVNSIYYGRGIAFTKPKKVLMLMISDKYGDRDIESISAKVESIKGSFDEYDLVCLPNDKKYVPKLEDFGVNVFNFRYEGNENYNKSLIEDLSQSLEDFGGEGYFWDFVFFFDIRNEVPSIELVKEAETKLMAEQVDFVFGGERSFLAERQGSCGTRHILTESGWTRYFDKRMLTPTIKLAPSRMLLARADALQFKKELFQNYGFIDMESPTSSLGEE